MNKPTHEMAMAGGRALAQHIPSSTTLPIHDIARKIYTDMERERMLGERRSRQAAMDRRKQHNTPPGA